MPRRSAPWIVQGVQQPVFPEPPTWLSTRVAAPAALVMQELEARGFTFLGPTEITECKPVLNAAAEIIDRVPSLADVVRQHVRWLSLLAADESYDISHSEPRWPDWIFVSCPTASGEVAALRVAENVVHEAMHLQLTIIERRVTLIEDQCAKLQSPWKAELRDLGGILHGLYVFRVVSRFLNKSGVTAGLSPGGIAHVRRRLDEISHEIAAVNKSELSDGLTIAGRSFLTGLVG